ncbi:MAG TPA: peptidoglycan DD-metalloendopeptidase family protein [Actinomycetota bacterium]|nr:peptidoglycan DD-metalloendopeptidase family protein [Actinomycetota bacterium]
MRVAALAAAILMILSGQPASAVTRKQLDDAKKRYQEVQEELNRLVGQHSQQEQKLAETRGAISSTEADIKKAQSETVQLNDQLKERVRTAYQMGSVGFFHFLLQAENFDEFSYRVVLLERQSSTDEELMLKLRRQRSTLSKKKAALRSQERARSQDVRALRDRGAEVNRLLARQEAVLSGLKAKEREEVARAAAASRVRSFTNASGGGGIIPGRVSRGGGGGGRSISLSACPAGGPRSFTNDWGAPRGGGRRRHKGNDIFASNGSPALAVVSGTISRTSSGGNGGLAIYLRGDDGNEYYYAHMSSFSASQGQRVGAGQRIAGVGNTGNARGGAAHIHFEIHPGGGGPINPYPSLIKVC